MDINEAFGHRTTIDRRDLETIDSCKKLVDYVFEEIAIRQGALEAMRIFSEFGELTKSQIKLHNDALVLRNFLKSGLNKRQFAIRLTKKGRNRGKNPTAIYRKLNRRVKSPRVRAYLNWLETLDLLV